ncbi:tetratricopeptide (TPR) repeat protein [Catalinimonas alkaloidigena]|uniref:DUF2911 domain-containing protein n=1 Tax=Catalinimonas alkaloidigena TaxID=1075417 RepID=UPI0024076126|nr:DUF2911 domain-containing protein [Catalinimonas alkaloidigena]MDF9799880.1 tetratricopeptide (TPR) repeat protein [Catalinimonas alkaloidigena]
MMKKLLYPLLAISFVWLATSPGLLAQSVTLPPSGDNQKSLTTQYIGSLAHVTIQYNSPDVTAPNGEDRTGKVWGQLVPYGLTNLGFGSAEAAPWRAGANENTTITFSHAMEVEGKSIAAGTYGLHMIVEENQPWVLILSRNASAWGSYFYDESEDALRVEIKPEESEFHEWLTYEFMDRQPDQTTLALMWENVKVPFTISVPDMKKLYVDNMRKELQSTAGFSWQGWNQAATYCLMNDTHLEEALEWAENAVSMPYIGQENFTTLQTKAGILSKLERGSEADEIMMQAINHPTATPLQIHAYGRQLISQGEKEKALEIFQLNAKKYPDTWPVNVGLARGYSATGDYKKAIKYAKMAATEAPDQLNKDSMQAAVENFAEGRRL